MSALRVLLAVLAIGLGGGSSTLWHPACFAQAPRTIATTLWHPACFVRSVR